MQDAIKDAFNKALQFKSRSRRSEFWYFALFQFILAVIGAFADSIIFHGTAVIESLVTFGLLLPGLSLSIRRLHDVNKSGWWLLLGMIPIIGGLVLIFWCIQDGTTGENQFGADPKGQMVAAV